MTNKLQSDVEALIKTSMSDFIATYKPDKSEDGYFLSPASEEMGNRIPSQKPNDLVKDMEARISNSVKKLHYGYSQQQYESKYRLCTDTAARKFWRNRLSKEKLPVSEEQISARVSRTLNVYPSQSFGKFTSERSSFFVDDFNSRIKRQVTIVCGPVGAGKSAFSKVIMCSQRHWFHQRKVIPSRVEFKKNQSLPLHDYILSCMFRDFMIFAIEGFGGIKESEVKNSIENDMWGKRFLSDVKLLKRKYDQRKKENLETALFTFIRRDYGSYSSMNTDWKRLHLILTRFALDHDIEFLVSFDGYDAIDAKDLILSDRRNELLVELGQIIKYQGTTNKYIESLGGLTCKYIVYLRDTTWNGLLSNISSSTYQWGKVEPYWIVPPSYQSVTSRALYQVGNMVSPNADQKKKIVRAAGTLRRRLKLYCNERGLDSDLVTLFDGNVRKAQEHFKDFFLQLFRIYTNREGLDLERHTSLASIFDEFLSWVSEFELKDYMINESLIYDYDGAFRNNIDITLTEINKLHDDGWLKEKLNSGKEDEDSRKVENIFNYCLKDNPLDEESASYYSYLLLKVRIAQIIESDGPKTIEQLETWLVGMGYRFNSSDALKWCLALLMKGQILNVKPKSVAGDFTQLEFYVTVSGQFILGRLMYSINYLSAVAGNSIFPKYFWRSRFKNYAGYDSRQLALYDVQNAIEFIGYISFIERWELGKVKKEKGNVAFWEGQNLANDLALSISKTASGIIVEAATSNRAPAKKVIRELDKKYFSNRLDAYFKNKGVWR